MAPGEKKLPGTIWYAILMMGVFFLVFARPASAAGERGSPESYRASRIIDQTVKNAGGEELGEVDDLVMSRNGKIKKVILSVGEYLGFGDRLIAVPFRSLRISDREDITYKITKEQLEKYPKFNYQTEGLYEYYYSPFPPYGYLGIPQPRGEREYYPYGPPYGPFPRGKYRGEFGFWEREYYPERLRVSAILGRSVLNEAGEQVGEIDDLIINRTGKVEQIILSVGGFLGLKEKLVEMPFKPLKVTDMGVVYNVSRKELKDRPEFSYRVKS
jgi:sporulation protein YlmC with PRC-barrel domain